MQLLDENHLLIKYASEDVVTLKTSDPNSQPSFFVVYNMVSTQVCVRACVWCACWVAVMFRRPTHSPAAGLHVECAFVGVCTCVPTLHAASRRVLRA